MGDEVVSLQTALQSLGYFPSTVLPIPFFGGVTEHAVQQFQVAQHLSPTGVFGPASQAALNAAQTGTPIVPPLSPAPSTSPRLTKFLYRGLKDPEVIILQNFLVKDGELAPDSVTGFFGRLTEAAVIALQKKYGIDPAGVAGKLTRAKINSLLAK